MADVAVVTDSTGYLPPALVDKLDITVVSQYYDVGAGPLRESEFDGDFARFYAELDASKNTAKTSAPQSRISSRSLTSCCSSTAPLSRC